MRWRPCSDRRTYGDDDLRQGGHARIGSFGLSSKNADRADLSLSGLAELLHYDQTYLDRVAAELNNRPRHIFGYEPRRSLRRSPGQFRCFHRLTPPTLRSK